MEYKFISFKNNAFTYTGVWQSDNSDEIVSYGTASQLSFGFTGGFVELFYKIVSGNNVEIYLDGERVEAQKTDKDSYIITADAAEHHIKFIIEQHSQISFKGIAVENEGNIFQIENNFYIQFIGDSITDAYPGFSRKTANNLDVDYSVVSACGMSLVDKWGWYKLPENSEYRIGIETLYFSIGTHLHPSSLSKYRFENCRTPDLFVIFVGTNDYVSTAEQKSRGNLEVFSEKYLSFIGRIRGIFPEKPIVILNDINKNEYRMEAIEKAVSCIAKQHSNIYMIDSNEWNVETFENDVHPTMNGYETMAKELTKSINNIINKL